MNYLKKELIVMTRISPYLVNNNCRNINFKQHNETEGMTPEQKKDYEKFCNRAEGGFIGAFIIALGLLGVNLHKENKPRFVDEFVKTISDPELKKDTFTVTDITGDMKPDVILYKKDGSQVIVDVQNSMIIE